MRISKTRRFFSSEENWLDFQHSAKANPELRAAALDSYRLATLRTPASRPSMNHLPAILLPIKGLIKADKIRCNRDSS